MTDRDRYVPGPARGAQLRKDGDYRRRILAGKPRQSRERVWQALAGPAHLRESAPFGAKGSLGAVGTVRLTTVERTTADHTTAERSRVGTPAMHAGAFGTATRMDLPEDHGEGQVPADILKRLAEIGSLYV